MNLVQLAFSDVLLIEPRVIGDGRGLHFQIPPHAQDKLVQMVRGAALDVVVDIRRDSPEFGRHVTALISAENKRQIFIPKGFAHGFLTLEPDTEVLYKTSDYHEPSCDKGLAWNDPALAIACHRTYGFPVLVSNCSNNYGPCQFPEKLIPLMIIIALENRALPVYGNGSNIRDWLHVEDHVRALHLILAKGRVGEKYNVGGRNERSNLQVVERVCELLDELRPTERPRRELISFVTDRPGHDRRYAIDATKLEGELGWRAYEGFDSGTEKTVRWYLDNEDWWRPLHNKVYGGGRLGLPDHET